MDLLLDGLGGRCQEWWVQRFTRRLGRSTYSPQQPRWTITVKFTVLSYNRARLQSLYYMLNDLGLLMRG
jgi:hypothetical protein